MSLPPRDTQVDPHGFCATRWTRVLATKGRDSEATLALTELCDAYYAPVHAYLRATLRDSDRARDLTHDFFARVLSRVGAFDGVDRERGRFRSFLLGAVKHFVSDTRDREAAQRRGVHFGHVPLESSPSDTSPGLEVADAASMDADFRFDREWALTVLNRSLEQLAKECEEAGKGAQFAVLKPWLTGDTNTPQATAAAALGMNENAVKVAIHRLRKRFRELVTAEIAQTVTGEAEQQAELRHLIASVSR